MFSLMSFRSNPSSSARTGGYHSVAVRLARPEDERAIQRIAALDGAKVPGGRVLVAEADGELIAALSVSDRQAVADPFRWTSDVMALMEMRADQLAGTDAVAATAAGGPVQQLRTQHA